MRKLLYLLCAVLLAGCSGGESSRPHNTSAYKPVLMEKTALPNSISTKENTDIHNPGKIFVSGNLLLVSEKYRGVHVYDNTDPKNPVALKFIAVPGCLDMALKDNIIYVDNATDLVAIDISNIAQPKVVSRVANVFPELTTPPDGMPLDNSYIANRPPNTIIVEWVKI